MRGWVRVCAFLAAVGVLLLAARAQRSRYRDVEEEGPRPSFPQSGEFHFIRVEYNDLPEFRRGFAFASRNARGRGWWTGRTPTTTFPSAWGG
jgi:hypothetical protein